MKIIIIEDSENIVRMYIDIFKQIVKENGFAKKIGDLEIETVDCDKEFKDKNLEGKCFDMAIIDWKLRIGTSEPILKKIYDKCKYKVMITGYAENRAMLTCSEKYEVNRVFNKFIGLNIIEDFFREAVDAI